MTKKRMKYTEKEFLEWKIDFLEDQVGVLNMPLEAGDVDAEDREILEEIAENIKTWIKELKKEEKTTVK